MEKKYLTVKEAAERLNVQPHTLRAWINQGKVKAYRLTARMLRLDAEELDAFMAKVATK